MAGGLVIVYTGGTFDVLHIGHVEFLAACRKLAGGNGEVIVGLNTDEFVMRYKQVHTVGTLPERQRILEACRYVDRVIVNEGDEDSRAAIELAKPDIVAIGVDWASKDYYAQMGFTPAWLAERDILLVYVAHAASNSVTSTQIRTQLRSGQW